MKKSHKKLELKKLTISKLNDASLVKGGNGSITCAPTNKSVFPQITCFLCPILESQVNC